MFISKRCGCASKDCKCGGNLKSSAALSKDLSLLSSKSRLDLLFILEDRSHCVCDLAAHTGMSQSLISHHLSDLAEAGLIVNKRNGKYTDYSLTPKGRRFLEGLSIILNRNKGGDN